MDLEMNTSHFNPYDHFIPIANMLNAVTAKQKLVSNNIANAQTPGFTAKSATFSQLLYNLDNPYETRLARKMGSSLQPLGAMETGEPVNLQKEMIDMQKNTLLYSMATRRASSVLNTLRTASQIGR